MDEIEIGLCWGTVQCAGLTEMIELAARHGFPTLAVPPHIYVAAQEAGETSQSLRRRLSDANVRVRVIDCISAGMPGMPPGAIILDGQRIRQFNAEECIAIADALEAPIINISLYNSRPVPISEMANAVAAVCQQAGPDRKIVLEFYPESGIATLTQAHAIAKTCGEPNCAVLLDCWHFARLGTSIAEIEALPPDSIGALQLSDRREPAPGTAYIPMTGRRLPGEGTIPLAALTAAALANSPGITAEVEVFSDELRGLPLDVAAARTAAAVEAWRSNLFSN